MSRYKKNMGDFGENAAEEMLRSKGYRILERQYRTKFGELDIIAVTPDESAVVFAEVKTRRNIEHGLAAESVSRTKVARMVKSAQQYLFENPVEADFRFDVIEVYTDLGGLEINHIENAFPDVGEFIDF